MKNLGKVSIPKGTIGFLSQTGFYDYWYPDREKKIIIPMDVVAEHLALWKHQGEFYAFKVPMIIFHPKEILEYKGQHVCVWFLQSEISSLI